MKALLLVVMLAIPAIPQGTDQSCRFTEISTCWQGCYRTICGGIGGGAGIGFAAKDGLWYSTCDSTGINAPGGVACQYMSLVISYQDCNGWNQFLMISPTCEADRIWLRSDAGDSKCHVQEDKLLPVPVQEIL